MAPDREAAHVMIRDLTREVEIHRVGAGVEIATRALAPTLETLGNDDHLRGKIQIRTRKTGHRSDRRISYNAVLEINLTKKEIAYQSPEVKTQGCPKDLQPGAAKDRQEVTKESRALRN